MRTDPREPYCVHSNSTQPASVCVECRDGEALAEWRAYWASPEGQADYDRRYRKLLTRLPAVLQGEPE